MQKASPRTSRRPSSSNANTNVQCNPMDDLIQEFLEKEFPISGGNPPQGAIVVADSGWTNKAKARFQEALKYMVYIAVILTLVLAITAYILDGMARQELQQNASKANHVGVTAASNSYFGSLRKHVGETVKAAKYMLGRKQDAENTLASIDEICPSLFFQCDPIQYYKTVDSYCKARPDREMAMGTICWSLNLKNIIVGLLKTFVAPFVAGNKLRKGEKLGAVFAILAGYMEIWDLKMVHPSCRVAIMAYAHKLFPLILGMIWNFVVMGLPAALQAKRAKDTLSIVESNTDAIVMIHQRLDLIMHKLQKQDEIVPLLVEHLPEATSGKMNLMLQQGLSIKSALQSAIRSPLKLGFLPQAQVKPQVQVKTQVKSQVKSQVKPQVTSSITKHYMTRARTKKANSK